MKKTNQNNQNEKFYSKFTEKKSSVKKVEAKAKAAAKESGKNTEKKSHPKTKTVSSKKTTQKENKTSHNFRQNQKYSQKEADALILNCTSAFTSKALPKKSLEILNDFDKIIQENRPLNSKQMQQLPDNIRELSHQLTDKRAERRLGYMNENVKLSAYVRYFTWWNLVRLTKLFSNLPEKAFPQNDCVCLDLGSGPLTLITALWLARPELRKKALTWYCLDLSQNSMTFGEDLYYSVAARTIANEKTQGSSETAWKIIRVKGSFGTAIKEKADFITCANMFNELDQAGDMPPEYQTKKYFDQLLVYSNKNTRFLLIEPGVPKAARTISLLRDRFIKAQKEILAPCPHAFECPMNGFKAYTGSSNKWCNFAFSTEDAPARLQKLSDSAKLPKERATLSYVCVLPQNEDSSVSTPKSKNKDTTLIRVVSDSFRLPGGRCGLYACSQFGLTLISMKDNGSERLKAARNNSEGIEKKSQLSLKSGDLIEVKIKTPVDSLSRDEKTGAKIISL